MKRVSGIGGVFFKCKNPEAMRDWYEKHLGIDMSPYGAKIENDKSAYTLWTPFPENSNYLGAPEQQFMINYRVADLEALLLELKKEGVTILDELSDSEYGKFLHIQDPEGNKIELWEAPE